MPTGRMRAVFMGTPEYVIPVMDVLCSLDAQVVAVYTQPDKPSGRDAPMSRRPLKDMLWNGGSRCFSRHLCGELKRSNSWHPSVQTSL